MNDRRTNRPTGDVRLRELELVSVETVRVDAMFQVFDSSTGLLNSVAVVAHRSVYETGEISDLLTVTLSLQNLDTNEALIDGIGLLETFTLQASPDLQSIRLTCAPGIFNVVEAALIPIVVDFTWTATGDPTTTVQGSLTTRQWLASATGSVSDGVTNCAAAGLEFATIEFVTGLVNPPV